MTTFVEQFQNLYSLTPNEAIAEFRTETNPEQTLREYVDEFVSTSEDMLDDFLSWQDEADAAIAQYQQPLMEKHADRDIWTELEPETIRRDSIQNYTDKKRTFSIDTLFQEAEKISSRDIWDRTSGLNDETVVLTEYGMFNPASTARAHAAWMRVRRIKRHDVEWLSIGSVQVNLYKHDAYCGAHNCKWTMDMNAADREEAEYLILMILQHLGTHAPKGDRAYPYPKIIMTPYFRNEDMQKVASHLRLCKNRNCNHGYLTDPA